MLPLTERTPKVLLPVRGRPFLAHLFDRLLASKASSVVLLVGHQSTAVADALATAPLAPYRELLPIVLSHDQPGWRGTASALVSALPHLEKTFVVTYGDSYLPIDYASPAHKLRAHSGLADGCMTVFENRDELEPSNAAVHGDWVVRYNKRPAPSDKLRYVDYGAIALEREVITMLPRRAHLGLEVVQQDLAARSRLLALAVPEPFHEIGSPAGLARLERALDR